MTYSTPVVRDNKSRGLVIYQLCGPDFSKSGDDSYSGLSNFVEGFRRKRLLVPDYMSGPEVDCLREPFDIAIPASGARVEHNLEENVHHNFQRRDLGENRVNFFSHLCFSICGFTRQMVNASGRFCNAVRKQLDDTGK